MKEIIVAWSGKASEIHTLQIQIESVCREVLLSQVVQNDALQKMCKYVAQLHIVFLEKEDLQWLIASPLLGHIETIGI